jgi:hypothetical protein
MPETKDNPSHNPSPFRATMFAAALLVVALGAMSLVRTADTRCADADVVIHAADRVDAANACDGARDAIRFLDAQGLRAPEVIEVHIVAELPDVANRTAVGAYLHAERRAYIIPFATFSTHAAHFALPADRALYRSLAAHEVAHVVAAANFSIKRPNVEAHEYIAYVTQIATMGSGLRERVLALPAAYIFDNPLQMNTAVYLSDPERFGVGAYRHYTQPGNGAEFLQQVLAGRVLAFQPP